MCGIFGYVGNRVAYGEVYDGLKKLEYRGYDSCGISVIDKRKFKTIKKVGGPEELKGKSKSKATIGIGHTRWATHGVVNNENTHPHLSYTKSVSLVHNGIVENYDDLKKFLIRNNVPIQSQTVILLGPNKRFLCSNPDPPPVLRSPFYKVALLDRTVF